MGADSTPPAHKTIRDLEVQLEQKDAEIAMLKEVTEVIGGEYNLQQVFDLVADCARDLIQAETVTIPVLSPDQTTYTYRAASGVNAEELLNAELPIEIGICGWVLRHRTPWWLGARIGPIQGSRNWPPWRCPASMRSKSSATAQSN